MRYRYIPCEELHFFKNTCKGRFVSRIFHFKLLCFSGARSRFLPGSSPAQEEDQGPQSHDGEGQEEPGKGGETAREAAQERAGAAEGGAVGSAPQ